jgi:hypothetical protein
MPSRRDSLSNMVTQKRLYQLALKFAMMESPTAILLVLEEELGRQSERNFPMDTCISCRHYFKPLNGPAGQGMCRRYPPMPVLIGMVQPKIAGQSPQPVVNGFFPPQSDGGTCGEYQRGKPLDIDLSGLQAVATEGQA